VSPRTRNPPSPPLRRGGRLSRPLRWASAAGAAAVLLALAFAWDEGLLRRAPPPLRPTPEALALGQRVLENKCLHCHAGIPLAPRVAGWSAERAYEALGRLPKLYPAMPPFHGTEDERRALALYLASLGAGGPPAR
jgi:mono/diheme cytochrome c family protein